MAKTLRRLFGRAVCPVHPVAHVLVEPPRGDTRRGRAQHEEAVDRGPGPRVASVAVHRTRRKRAQNAVFEDDVADRDAEREPVLVERQHGDHHEEMEVRLDLAVPGMHQHGRRGEEPEHHGDRARPATRGAQRSCDACERDRDDQPEGRLHAESTQQRKHGQHGDMRPENPEEGAVPRPPGVLRQGPAARKRVFQTCESVLAEEKTGQTACIGTRSRTVERPQLRWAPTPARPWSRRSTTSSKAEAAPGVSTGRTGAHPCSLIHSPYGCSAPGPAPKQMMRVPGSSAQ